MSARKWDDGIQRYRFVHIDEFDQDNEDDFDYLEPYIEENLDGEYCDSEDTQRTIERLQSIIGTLIGGLMSVEDLMNNSTGVIDFPLNCGVVPWRELRKGGTFQEWLMSFDAALNAVNKWNEEQNK